jgi:hypothetical protein
LDPLSSSEIPHLTPPPPAIVVDIADAKELKPFLPNALPLQNSVAVAKQAAGVAQEALSSVVSLVKTSLHEKANSHMSTSFTSSSLSYGMPVAP